MPIRSLLHWRYLVPLAALAIACGLAGAAFTVVLVAVERLVFGFTAGPFAEAAAAAGPVHRFVAVALAGVAVAIAWYLMRRHGPRIPTVDEMAAGARVSPAWLVADTTLQVINVGAGASIGREGAPRQVGALAGVLAGDATRVDGEVLRVLAACGAGAGLASIYNVPFGGTLFAVEIVLGWAFLRRARGASGAIAASALACAWGATLVARIVIPDRPTYALEGDATDASLVVLAVVAGPLLGAAGAGFGRALDRVRSLAPRGARILVVMPLCYLVVGALSIAFPLVLGNGQSLAQGMFEGTVPLATVVALCLAKPIATLLTSAAGASGGRLTPSLATGAAMGTALAAAWTLAWPVAPTGAAVVGAAAFLAGATRAPVTAAVLAVEFTGAAMGMWPVVALACAGAWAASRLVSPGK